ncbi:CHAT domain-containing protein [Dactylonectria macrodidyma]|uniref:CHAT domain-containing protein n=1 Tax=Dactylonectria macrodidyma TaxID=307937 RepID=A0A9P9IMK4_9HYPO|nr:CHAT domain-containing protein [Dactylonectria macrodidyma]
MDFTQVLEVFGGTIFAEEYRTNFKDSEDWIQAFESATSNIPTNEERAALLLLRAIQDALRGNLSGADRYLADLQCLAQSGLDSAWLSRCRTYQSYLLSLKRAPAILRFWPDVESQSGQLRDAKLQMFESKQQLRSERRNRASSWSVVEELESNLIWSSFWYYDNLWKAYDHNQSYPNSTWGFTFDSTEIYPPETPTLAVTLELPTLKVYLDRIQTEYQQAGGTEGISALLQQFYETCISAGDLAGAANFRLLQADHILSPPYTSPLALNLMPLDHGLSWSNSTWDRLEPQFTLRHNDTASSHYEEALNLFERAGKPRGQGAVYLRMACVMHAEAIFQSPDGRARPEFLQPTLGSLNNAHDLFRGDFTNTQLVAGHRLLLDIATGCDSSDLVERATNLGSWGLQADNNSVSRFIGLLVLRFGRKLYAEKGSTDAALKCCACAKACFRGLGDKVLELHALVAHAELQRDCGNLGVARVLADQGRQLFPQSLAQLDSLIEAVSGKTCAPDAQTIQFMKTNYHQGFNRVMNSIEQSSTSAFASRGAHQRLTGGSSLPAVVAALARMMSNYPGLSSQFENAIANPAKELGDLQSEYFEVIRQSQEALLQDADADASERIFRDFISSLDNVSGFKSKLLDTLKLATLHHLGEFGRAQSILDSILPVVYGGKASDPFSLPLPSGAALDLRLAEQQRQEGNVKDYIGKCFIAKAWRQGATVLENTRRLFPELLKLENLPKDADNWTLMVWIACIEENNGNLDTAFEWYLATLRLVESQRSQMQDPDARRDVLSTINSGELISGLARIALRFDAIREPEGSRGRLRKWNLPGPTWKDQALLFLEQGRARGLLDLLIMEKKVTREALKAWSDESYRIRLLSESLAPRGDERDKAATDVAERLGVEKTKLSAIQAKLETQSKGIASMLSESGFSSDAEGLYRCIPQDAAVAYITLSREGLLLLGVTCSGIEIVHQSDLTDLEIQKTVLACLKLLGTPKTQGEPPAPAEWMALLEPISAIIVEPLAPLIRRKNHIIFAPSHSFNKFPFSALIFDGEPLFLKAAVSLIPSLCSLQRLVDKQNTSNEIATSVIVKPGVRDGSVGGSPLPFAGIGGVNLGQVFGSTTRNANNVSREEFKDLYQSSDVVFIATHGLHTGTSPWQSSILLQQPFRVLELAELRSKAAIVIFAACVSGLGKETVGNDILGFSHAVLASGASSYLGGLWNVNDLATMLLTHLFCRRLKNCEPGVSFATCWRNAQIELYRMDQRRAIELLEEMGNVWDMEGRKGNILNEIPSWVRSQIDIAIEDIQDMGLDYTHPYFWAPFVLIGHGGLVLHDRD